MTECPFCSRLMVRRIHNHQTAWFCHHCWLEIPDSTSQDSDSTLEPRTSDPIATQPAAPSDRYL